MHQVSTIKFVMISARYVIHICQQEDFERISFITCTKIVQFEFTIGVNSEQNIVDIRKTDVWPSKAIPQVWLYKPCPAKTISFVGQRYLMKVWRKVHHVDRLIYEEWKQHAS